MTARRGSDRCGRSRLYQSTNNAGDHRLYESPEARETVEVESVTLDSVFRDRPARVVFIKMDVQDSEGVALERMTALLGRCPRVKITREFWLLRLARAGYGAEKLLARLEGLAFRVYELDKQNLAVRRADARRLLERFRAASEYFTSLLCVKAPLGVE